MSTVTHAAVFYLTSTGWVKGTEPPDCVEAWRCTISDDGRVSWRCEWVDLHKARADRDALREKFQAFLASAATAQASDAVTRH
jgi:hypothetical protein